MRRKKEKKQGKDEKKMLYNKQLGARAIKQAQSN
jgi:hypothetical protein